MAFLLFHRMRCWHVASCLLMSSVIVILAVPIFQYVIICMYVCMYVCTCTVEKCIEVYCEWLSHDDFHSYVLRSENLV